MKLILSSMLAFAIAGSPLLAWQEPQVDKDKAKQEEPKKPEPKPKPDEKSKQEPQPDERSKPKPEKPKQEAPPPREQKQEEKQQKEHAKQNQKQQQAAPGGRARGQKIPEQKFHASFGREHHFRVARNARDEGRFQYGGYWFEVVDVWPAGWSFDDDCYVEEDGDDYYLVDIIHPEVRVLVIVVEG